MMAAAFFLGYIIGVSTMMTAIILAFLTPEEIIQKVKEKRLKYGKQVRADQGSRHSGTN